MAEVNIRKNHRKMVGVMGSSTPSLNESQAAEKIGAAIATRNLVLITGGLGGVMEAASRGAHNAGGLVVGLSSGVNKWDMNKYVHIPIPTGLSGARNFVNICVCDAVVALGSMQSAGTLSEISFALQRGVPLMVYESPEPMRDFLQKFAAPGKARFGENLSDVEKFLDRV